ncbi:hypothetical protein [Paenibacillus sp. DMB5]|uniref:hypothetical protein n=1 Tax=Paenibacillus sp. DMB5 TaxID=1780103 RepID=UPI00076DA985|nr:hypothetical protein [Paenibacillus sp. DMB5]KUP25810.1 hypothetical protein AWJ19_19495 [Paenibacillus sp. DMB5]
MYSQTIKIHLNDIVKILSGYEAGKYAKVLRIHSIENDLVHLTLKINSYWNSTDYVKRFGIWKGQLWIAIIKTNLEVQLKNNNVQI